jgi:hypothetical protein
VIKAKSRIGVCLRLGVVLLAAALAGSALARPAEARNAVPFRGRLEGTATSVPLTPPFIDTTFVATGHASHLGRFTLTMREVVNLEAATSTQTFEFVAANGDTLTAAGTGTAAPAETPGVLAIVETGTITGGTGRFAGATGSFTVERLLDTPTGISAGSFSGTLSLRDDGDDGDD